MCVSCRRHPAAVLLFFFHDASTSVVYTLSLHDALPIFDREADAPALEVEVDDLDPQLLARVHHLLGQVDVVGEELWEIGRAHSELQSRGHLVCRLLLEKKKTKTEVFLSRQEYETFAGST